MDSSVESLSECSSTEPIATESSSVVIVHKPRLKKPVWQSPVWQFFVIAEDIKCTECHTCDELVARRGASTKIFNTTNLVSHLKLHHEEFERFWDIRKNKETQHKVADRQNDCYGQSALFCS